MTRGDKIRAWNDLQLANFLTMIERKAVENKDKLDNVSDGTLIGDWILFLAKEDNDANNS